MRESIKLAREIAKKCFRVNEVVNGTEYAAVFDTKLCAQLLEEKFTSTNTASPKLPTVEELIDSISSDHNRWNEAIAHDPLWIAMIKITHDIISRQLRAGV
jgi:hypothetical protein